VAPRSGDGVGEAVETAIGGATSSNRSRRQRGTTARARRLRQGGNKAEALLWLELKNRKLGGYRFTRQLPIGRYFADLACREQWLVVEVDGRQHANSAHDDNRDALIRAQGYSVLRFWNADVLSDRRAVCDTILAALEGRLEPYIGAFDLRYRQARHSSHPADPLTTNQQAQQDNRQDSTSSKSEITS
jgi:very-short-patch-repair endonuclease